MTDSVGRFFDDLSDDYTAAIERCFPRYREMLWALLDYLPRDRGFDSILELGCGTGNLSMLLAHKFSLAEIRLVDVSGESLGVCRSRLGDDERFAFQQDDFRDLDYDAGGFDLVISNISVHHLTSSEKQSLFTKVRTWLTDRGVFTFADQFSGATDDLYARHIENWKEQSTRAGGTPQEWQMWMEHQEQHDHHDSLAEQIEWLREAGFSVADGLWRYLLWTVVQARP